LGPLLSKSFNEKTVAEFGGILSILFVIYIFYLEVFRNYL